MNYLILVNKENPLTSEDGITNLVKAETRVPGSVEIDRYIILESQTKESWLELKKVAFKVGFDFDIDSGYRTIDYQQKLLDYYINKDGKEAAYSRVALPGTSEHHTGLAIDYSFFRDGVYIENIKETDPEYIWILNNAYKFGFILRYPKDKTHITGYIFEPWHLRYVGKDHAEVIYKNNLTLEEYLIQIKTKTKLHTK